MKTKQPLLAKNSKRTLRRKMPSGLEGWVSRLRANYFDFEEWVHYSDMYGLAVKLGYQTATTAWKENPIICGSVNPSDYGRDKGK